MSPGPVSRHEITITPLVVLKLAVRNIVNAINQVRVGENVVDDVPRIAIPDLVIGRHPFRCGSVVRAETVVPGDV